MLFSEVGPRSRDGHCFSIERNFFQTKQIFHEKRWRSEEKMMDEQSESFKERKKSSFFKNKKPCNNNIFFLLNEQVFLKIGKKNWSLYYWTNDFSKNFLINNSFLRFCWPKDLEKTIGYFTDWKILLNEWFYWTNYSTKITNDCSKQSFTRKRTK